MTRSLNFTKATLDALPAAKPGSRETYHDSKTPGLQLRVTESGVKTFSVYRWLKDDKKPQRRTLGRYPQMTIEQARTAAAQVNALVEAVGNPGDELKAKRAKGVTLRETFAEFLRARKNLSPRTVYSYERIMGFHAEEDRTDARRSKHKPRRSGESFKDWLDKPIVSITKDMVEKRHAKMGEFSHAQANCSMRVLRTVLNFAAAKYENSKGEPIIAENPVKRLSQTRAWYPVGRRSTVLRLQDLKPWFAAVLALPTVDGNSQRVANAKPEDVRDYLLFLILTGARRTEAAKLRWDQVDLIARTFTFHETKNKQRHTLPLSDYLYDMLSTRKEAVAGDYVFPGTGKAGYLVETRRQTAKVVEESGVSFTLHDLRRTFITIAESLDIPAYALKRLLNHKSGNDVTAGYIVMDVERLREPMQLVTDYILRTAGLRPTAVVSPLRKRQHHE